MKCVMLLQVYDKNRAADEFMGSSSISLKNLDLYRWVLYSSCMCYRTDYFTDIDN